MYLMYQLSYKGIAEVNVPKNIYHNPLKCQEKNASENVVC